MTLNLYGILKADRSYDLSAFAIYLHLANERTLVTRQILFAVNS
jgi:hypothetical protein